MFDYLYDDYFHLGQSCFQVENKFLYRPLIYRIFCSLDNNVLAIKTLSLLSIIISIFIIYQILIKEKIISKGLQFFIILLNPIILFPVFYTSQFTTAITFLWCMLSFNIIYNKFKYRHLIYYAALGVIGLGLRFESFYYLLLISIVFFVLFWGSYSYIQRGNNFFNTLKLFFNKKNQYRTIIIKLFSFISTFFILSALIKLQLSFYPSQLEVLEVYKASFQEYPPVTHIFIQIYALILYLINFILPSTYTFFGPWSDWITIHFSTTYQILLGVTYLLILISALYFSQVKYRYSDKKWPYLGILIFVLAHSILSFRMRVDWYFISRQFVGSIFLYICLYIFFQNKKNFRGLIITIFLYFTISTLIQILFHFKDLNTFTKFEHLFLGNKSPNATLYYVQKIAKKNEKIELLKASSEYISGPIRDSSQIAIKLYDDLSFLGYISSYETQNSDAKEYFFQKSMETYSYSSALVCLLEPEERWKTCLLPQRIQMLCKTIIEGTMLNHKRLPLKIDLDEYCKNKKKF